MIQLFDPLARLNCDNSVAQSEVLLSKMIKASLTLLGVMCGREETLPTWKSFDKL